jgi:hypothetical protein
MRRGSALVVGILVVVAAVLLLRLRQDREAPSALDAGREAEPSAPTLAPRSRGTAPRGRTAEIRTGDDAPADAPSAAKAPTRVVSLRVLLVDAASGERVEGAWFPGDPLYAASRSLRALVTHEMRPGDPLVKDGFVLAGEAAPAEFGTDSLRFQVTLRLPPDRCRWEASEVVAGVLAAGVSEVRFVVPVYRAIPLRLTVRGPDGRIAKGAEVAAVTVGGRRLSARGSASTDGELEVPVPFLPGEEARVALDWSPNPDESLAAEALTPEEGIRDPEWRGAVPESPWDSWTAEVPLKGPCRHILDHNETDFDNPTEEVLSEDMGDAPTRAVTVHVLDRDGAPVTSAEVQCEGVVARPDGAGAAVFEKVRPGLRHFTMAAAGRLSRIAEASVPRDGECVVELREPLGAVLEVVVVGEDDRPRPFAEVTPAAAFFDTAGAVQRLDPYTDALGHRTFSRVQPGKTFVRASWAGHSGHATADLVDGERTRLRLVVK